MLQSAREKIEKETLTGGAAEMQQMIMCWLECDPGAAELIMAADKSVSGAYSHLEALAKKIKQGSNVCITPPEAAKDMLEYFGYAAEEAQAKLEGGLMHQMIIEYLKRWKPYEAMASVESKVQELPKQTENTSKRNVPDLSAFSLEDML